MRRRVLGGVRWWDRFFRIEALGSSSSVRRTCGEVEKGRRTEATRNGSLEIINFPLLPSPSRKTISVLRKCLTPIGPSVSPVVKVVALIVKQFGNRDTRSKELLSPPSNRLRDLRWKSSWSGEGIGAPGVRFEGCHGWREKAAESVPSIRKRTCCFVIVDPLLPGDDEEGRRTIDSSSCVVSERMETKGGGERKMREVLTRDPTMKESSSTALNL